MTRTVAPRPHPDRLLPRERAPRGTARSAPPARLSRGAGHGRPAAPVRIVHLGLGSFFRAHQAWYTDRAPDADDWGIAAFTGRSTALADALASQDGLYTLVTKTAHGDEYDVVSSVSAVHPASDQAAWLGFLRSPEVAIVTLTVTEAGYCRDASGGLDLARADVAADLEALRTNPAASVRTVPARLVAGLAARRQAAAGPLAILACDNLPGNGAVTARVVREFAEALDASLPDWIARQVSFVTTMVDRITPRTTGADEDAVLAATGLADRAPVVTEPFAEWVLGGDFPAGRPSWDAAGAEFVDDVAPFEERKLWLLNGSHSLLAYAASVRGHTTVSEAIADPVCRAWVEDWWDVASRHLLVPKADITAYRTALLERFGNPSIRHALAQIAADGSQKLPIRVLPALRAERAAGRMPAGAVRPLAAWTLHLRGLGAPVSDSAADRLAGLADVPLAEAAAQVVQFLAPDLAGDADLVDAVRAEAEGLLP